MFDFNKQFKTGIEKPQSEHLEELQSLIEEFEDARDFMKREISNRETLLEQAAHRYTNRESREDDKSNL